MNLIFGVGVGVFVFVAEAEAVDSGLAVEREVLLGVEVELELFFEEERFSFSLSPFDPEVPGFEFKFEVEELGPATFDLSSSMDLRRSSSSQSSLLTSSAFPFPVELLWEAWSVRWLLPPSLSLSLIGCGVDDLADILDRGI